MKGQKERRWITQKKQGYIYNKFKKKECKRTIICKEAI